MFTDRPRPNYPGAVRRRSPVPHLILGVMTVLAIGAVILGLALAPNTSVLTVHNGAGTTLLANQVTVVVSEPSSSERILITYVAPDYAKETLLSGGSAGVGHPSRTYHGAQAKTLGDRVLQPVSELQKMTAFVKTGTGSATRYTGRLPASELVPANEAHLVSGHLTAIAQVTNGYVVRVTEKANLTTPAGTTKETIHSLFTKVDGWTVPKG